MRGWASMLKFIHMNMLAIILCLIHWSSAIMHLYSASMPRAISVNYYGWTEAQLSSFLTDYGFSSAEAAHEMYTAFIANPANYCKYVLGFLGFEELKNRPRKISVITSQKNSTVIFLKPDLFILIFYLIT